MNLAASVESDSTKARKVITVITPTRPARPTTAQICADAGISPRLYQMVAKVHRLACPEVWAQLVTGALSAHLALQICAADHDGQRLILSEMAGMKSREKTRFVRTVFALRECGEVA